MTKTSSRSKSSSNPPPPGHLGASGRQTWAHVVENFVLEPHHLSILQAACEARDRAESCRAQIERDGLTQPDRFGKPRMHPLLPVERDARAAFIRAMQGLGLDVVAPGPPGRPPGGNRT